jgi:transcriptional regulator of acetoin/glycerol metabolism
MQAMVEHVARTAVNGSVTVADLPSSVKSLPRRQLTPLQRSDREVIAAHLRACNGNKVHVARALGISRSTLYKKLRELELTTPV